MISLKNKVVCITGASSGIGEACAVEFAKHGCTLILAARRKQRLDTLAEHLRVQHGVKVYTIALDVRIHLDVEAALSSLPAEYTPIDVLVNNAGLSRGLDKLHQGSIQDWEEMIDTNVKGLLYVTRAVLPGMVARNSGHIINIGSIAGQQVYPNGNVYCASKFAVTALSEGMRLDLLGTDVRISSVDPGLVETEFSEVRFRGNTQRASQVYANLRPLTGEDIADIVVFCATRPPHVDIGQVVVMSIDQASANHVYRKG
jgi:NADP-dependent 3-hydroxy acid dehydrogenase YdfG